MDSLQEIVRQIELHSFDGIRDCFQSGITPNDTYKGEPLIYELISAYLRGPKFKKCVRVFVEFGLEFEDKALLSVLLDNSDTLRAYITDHTEIVHEKYTLKCAYTPLSKVTLLHICAEFNHVACAEVLLQNGADVNAIAGIDSNGFGGQTPIFHTVNQNLNQSAEMLDFLLSRSADLKLTVKGLIWGQGHDWETLMPAVNPISYAMMGLLPQMHRNETVISETVSKLLRHAFGIDYTAGNIPNKYLQT
ncbi:ankyrin repeat domain-containing protein [Ulvibacterium sp.]|uniref:ankyrin repeat domain-containing protein n=1 Tax=Ulvibacterium sp. TaxID=2665914 RepID=UPI0026345977|nr:ankyrin repeat domain-containing protein [Ulvibacterium sp.]